MVNNREILDTKLYVPDYSQGLLGQTWIMRYIKRHNRTY